MYALVSGSEPRVYQVSDAAAGGGEPFPVADPLRWVQCPNTVTEFHTFNGQGFDAPAASNSPGPVFTYKVDLFRRATEDEAEQIDIALAATSAKMRHLFSGATRLEHDAEEFLTLQAAAIQLFGQERADELLAPSA